MTRDQDISAIYGTVTAISADGADAPQAFTAAACR